MILKSQLYSLKCTIKPIKRTFFYNQGDNNGALKNTNINDISSVR